MIKIRRTRNLLRRVSIHRVWNIVLSFSSYLGSLVTGKIHVWGMPWTLTIEPTNLCNLRCPECPSGSGRLKRPRGVMNVQTFRRIIDEIDKETFYIQLFFQGEPFLNTHLIDFISYAHNRNIYVSVNTNAQLIDEALARSLLETDLDRLIVSLDGATAESYNEYRIGGEYSRVLNALDLLQQQCRITGNSVTEIAIQFLITRFNEHEISQMKRIGKKYGAEVILKTMQVHSTHAATTFLPRNREYSRYEFSEDTLHIRGNLRNRCRSLWERSVVCWDGTVIPCCFDKNAEITFGNILQSSFREIWLSDKYIAFRERILKNRKSVPMCLNCTEGINIYR